MKWSCRLEVLPGQGVAEKLRHAAAFGFDEVALPGRYRAQWEAEARACEAGRTVGFSSVSLGFHGSLVSPDAAQRAACRASLIALFDLCGAIGARAVNMPPVLIQDNAARFRDAAAQDALLTEQLPALCDAARQRGVVLCLEPVNREESDYMNRVADAARVCGAVRHPNLGVTVDFFHMAIEEDDAAAAIRAAGGGVRLVHIAERITRTEPRPGAQDFGPGFRALKAVGYDDVIEIECRTLSGPAESVLPRSVACLKQAWAEAERMS